MCCAVCIDGGGTWWNRGYPTCGQAHSIELAMFSPAVELDEAIADAVKIVSAIGLLQVKIWKAAVTFSVVC